MKGRKWRGDLSNWLCVCVHFYVWKQCAPMRKTNEERKRKTDHRREIEAKEERKGKSPLHLHSSCKHPTSSLISFFETFSPFLSFSSSRIFPIFIPFPSFHSSFPVAKGRGKTIVFWQTLDTCCVCRESKWTAHAKRGGVTCKTRWWRVAGMKGKVEISRERLLVGWMKWSFYG